MNVARMSGGGMGINGRSTKECPLVSIRFFWDLYGNEERRYLTTQRQKLILYALPRTKVLGYRSFALKNWSAKKTRIPGVVTQTDSLKSPPGDRISISPVILNRCNPIAFPSVSTTRFHTARKYNNDPFPRRRHAR